MRPFPAPLPEIQPETEVEWGNIPAPVQPEAQDPPIPWMAILTWVWLGGMGLMGVYALWSVRRILRQIGPSVDAGDGVYLCDYIDTPFLLGFRKPRIYLPSSLEPETAAFVLAHERSHIRRRDHWWKPIGFVLLSIHWFNPVIWLSYVLLCRDIEMACDEAVIRRLGEDGKKGYSQALLRCSLPRSTIAICPLAFGEVSVRSRIKSILHYKRPALWLTILGIAAVIAGAVFFLTDPVEELPEETAATEETVAETEPAAPFAEELAQMKPDPPRIRKEEVEYFMTAHYYSDLKDLYVTQYDDNFRIKEEISYENGFKIYEKHYRYFGDEDTLFTLMTISISPSAYNHFINGDGYNLRGGESADLTIREQFDKNGNVLEELTYNGNELTCTRTFTYDKDGNMLTSTTKDRDREGEAVYTYDAAGHLIKKTSHNLRKEDMDEYSYEYRYTYDENGFLVQMENDDSRGAGYTEVYTNDAEGNPLTVEDGSYNGRFIQYSYDKGANLTVKDIRNADGTSPSRFLSQKDDYGNEIRTFTGEPLALMGASNYIGTDGSRSIGIPREIFDEGIEESPMPDLTIPPMDYEVDEVKDMCLNALRDFLMNYEGQIKITEESGTTELAKLGQDYRLFYTQPGAHEPDLALLKREGIVYTDQNGRWVPCEETLNPLNWYEDFLYNRDELTFVSDTLTDGVREITYDAGSETITYRFLDGQLFGLRRSVDDKETTVTIIQGTSRLYDLFETESKKIAPPAEAAPAPFLTKAEEIGAYEDCMKALNDLKEELFYQLTISHTAEGRLPDYSATYARKGSDLLFEHYAAGASLPLRSQTYIDGLYYTKPNGTWLFDSPLPNTETFEWYKPFQFDLEDATAIKIVGEKDSRAITFDLRFREGREEAQRNHKLTFHLRGNTLMGIQEEGIYTAMGETQARYENELTLNTTSQWLVGLQFQNLQKVELMKCRGFSWEEERNAENPLPEGTFQKTTSPINTPQDAFRYAPREQAGEYSWVQVYRDIRAKMWKVEFAKIDGSSKAVYLSDAGEVKLTVGVTPNTVSKADQKLLDTCGAALKEIQSLNGFDIQMNDARWLQLGEDVLYLSDSGIDWIGPMCYLRKDGKLFNTELADVQSPSMEALNWASVEALPPYVEEEAPWLISCDWDSLDKKLLSYGTHWEGDEKLETITVEIRTPYRSPYTTEVAVADEYTVTFYFSEEGAFQKAELTGYFRHEKDSYADRDGTQTFTMIPLSTDEGEIAKVIQREFDRAQEQNQ